MYEKWDYKKEKYSSYEKLLNGFASSSYETYETDILGSYMKNNDWSSIYKSKREETPQEKEARLLREKASARDAKIDSILKKQII